MTRSTVVRGAHKWRVTYRKTQMRAWRAVRLTTNPRADDDRVGSYEAGSIVTLMHYLNPYATDTEIGRVFALRKS
jgi:hypothetical protein